MKKTNRCFEIDMRTPDFGYIYFRTEPYGRELKASFNCFVVKNTFNRIANYYFLIKESLITNYIDKPNYEIIAKFEKGEIIEF